MAICFRVRSKNKIDFVKNLICIKILIFLYTVFVFPNYKNRFWEFLSFTSLKCLIDFIKIVYPKPPLFENRSILSTTYRVFFHKKNTS